MKTVMQVVTMVCAVPIGVATFLVCMLFIHPAILGHNVYTRYVSWMNPEDLE